LGSILITGVGVVSPAGLGLAALSDAVRRGRSFTRLIGPSGAWLGAPACGFDAEASLGRREARRLDRGAQLFAAAARMALEDAGLWGRVPDGRRAGVFEGTALGGLGSALEEHARLIGPPAREPRPRAIVSGVSGSGAALVCLAAGLEGPSLTFSTGRCPRQSRSGRCRPGAARDRRLGARWGGEAPLDRPS
jgi:3-oxoacyl-[acyl-carrier-protein] synthase II